MSNIREVAKHAGVSTATISRYLSHPEKLSAKTTEVVKNAIDALNYEPNLLARNFSKSRAYAVLVLVPDIANPFFSRVIKGIEDEAQRKGYSVLLGNTRYCNERERSYLQLVKTRQADGIIQLSYNLPFPLDDEGCPPVPFVQACESITTDKFPTVKINNLGAAKALTSHLTQLGHTNIACILGPRQSPLTKDRLQGYREALENAGINPSEQQLIYGDFSMLSGFNAAFEISSSRPPTAIFCMNDDMAIGLIRGLRDRGISVPDDISVVGFDDIEQAKYSDPPLTTVSQPTEALGRQAMAYLYELLDTDMTNNPQAELPTELVFRASTAAPKR